MAKHRKIGPTGRVDPVEMSRLLRNGVAVKDVAKKFGVSSAAISQRKSQINSAVQKNFALENASLVASECIDEAAQLKVINDKTNQMLDMLLAYIDGDIVAKSKIEAMYRSGKPEKGKPPVIYQDPMIHVTNLIKEIRGQLKLSVDVLTTVIDIKETGEFQRAIIEEIGAESPDCKRRIINRLKNLKLLRKSASIV